MLDRDRTPLIAICRRVGTPCGNQDETNAAAVENADGAAPSGECCRIVRRPSQIGNLHGMFLSDPPVQGATKIAGSTAATPHIADRKASPVRATVAHTTKPRLNGIRR